MAGKGKQPNINITLTGNEINAGRDITIGQQNIENTYRSNSSATVESFAQDIDAIQQVLQQSLADQAKLDEVVAELESIKSEAKKDSPDKNPLLEKVKSAFETISAAVGAAEAIEKLTPLLSAALGKAVSLFS